MNEYFRLKRYTYVIVLLHCDSCRNIKWYLTVDMTFNRILPGGTSTTSARFSSTAQSLYNMYDAHQQLSDALEVITSKVDVF